MAFLGRSKSDTHKVKPAKVSKIPRLPKLSRKEKKAAKQAAKAASAMSAAVISDNAEPSYAQPAPRYERSMASANEPRMGDLTVGDYANGMPAYSSWRIFQFIFAATQMGCPTVSDRSSRLLVPYSRL